MKKTFSTLLAAITFSCYSAGTGRSIFSTEPQELHNFLSENSAHNTPRIELNAEVYRVRCAEVNAAIEAIKIEDLQLTINRPKQSKSTLLRRSFFSLSEPKKVHTANNSPSIVTRKKNLRKRLATIPETSEDEC